MHRCTCVSFVYDDLLNASPCLSSLPTNVEVVMEGFKHSLITMSQRAVHASLWKSSIKIAEIQSNDRERHKQLTEEADFIGCLFTMTVSML
eukprot:2037187-Amphidinium_carterae.1